MVKREKSINEIDVKCLVFDLLLFRALYSGQRGCNISGRLLGYVRTTCCHRDVID